MKRWERGFQNDTRRFTVQTSCQQACKMFIWNSYQILFKGHINKSFEYAAALPKIVCLKWVSNWNVVGARVSKWHPSFHCTDQLSAVLQNVYLNNLIKYCLKATYIRVMYMRRHCQKLSVWSGFQIETLWEHGFQNDTRRFSANTRYQLN
jgi:hypothetical protein